MAFLKAQRKQVKLKIAIAGPSGSGKTLSSLLIARGIGKKIALIDTENGSASLYSDKVDFEYDTDVITPPFTPEKYILKIEEAEKAGYDVIIIDSLSHAWAGEGGTLDKKSEIDARDKGNQFTNWKIPKQSFAKLKNAILHSSCHIIVTLRSKQAYELVDDNGKKKPQKMGLAPISEPDIEYEFTLVLDMAMNNSAAPSKDRTGLFRELVFTPTKATGEMIMKWHSGGATVESKKQTLPADSSGTAKPSENELPHCKTCEALMLISKSGKHYFCPNWQDGREHNPVRVNKKPVQEPPEAPEGPEFNDDDIPF